MCVVAMTQRSSFCIPLVQELTPADVERMNRDLRRLEEQLSLTTKQKEDVISQLWNLESEFGQLMSDVSVKDESS